jgi:HTH-type transcriptional regulator / antitoxin HigA
MIALATIAAEVQPEYARLLSEALPSVIDSEEQNELYLEQVSDLLRREDSLTLAEAQLLKLLTLLIEDFEEKHYAVPASGPLAVLTFLMDQYGLKQKDLSDIFGTPSITSEILSGKRELNKEQIRRLSQRFHVSPELFF